MYVQNLMKIVAKISILSEIWTTIGKSLTKCCSNFEFGAVQMCVNLVELEKILLKNEYVCFIWGAKIDLDTEENEPSTSRLKNRIFIR